MTLSLSKVRGSNKYLFQYTSGVKWIQWEVDGADVDVSALEDIINVIQPPIQPTVPAIPLNGIANLPSFTPNTDAAWDAYHNAGAEAADKAAHEEEQRLMNMGAALKNGINMGPEDIPVFDNGELPPVNWSQ